MAELGLCDEDALVKACESAADTDAGGGGGDEHVATVVHTSPLGGALAKAEVEESSGDDAPPQAVGVLGNMERCAGVACLRAAPYLTDLAQWTQWHRCARLVPCERHPPSALFCTR